MYSLRTPQSSNDFKHYYHFRWRQLRQPWGQAEGSEIDELDADSFHIMVTTETMQTEKNQIVGIGRLQLNTADEAQIRYMAVAPQHRHRGIGHLIVSALEQQARKLEASTVVLDARHSAVGFYEKQGYQILHKSHLLFGKIQHFKMLKSL